MTYKPKTYAERRFRQSVYWSSKHNRRQKIKKNSWYNDGWWEEGYLRRLASLKHEHEKEMRNWKDYT